MRRDGCCRSLDILTPKAKHLLGELGREENSVQSAKFVVVEASTAP
jgi:hypothetical protein